MLSRRFRVSSHLALLVSVLVGLFVTRWPIPRAIADNKPDITIAQNQTATIPAGYICSGDATVNGLPVYDTSPDAASTALVIITAQSISYTPNYGNATCNDATAANLAVEKARKQGEGYARIDIALEPSTWTQNQGVPPFFTLPYEVGTRTAPSFTSPIQWHVPTGHTVSITDMETAGNAIWLNIDDTQNGGGTGWAYWPGETHDCTQAPQVGHCYQLQQDTGTWADPSSSSPPQWQVPAGHFVVIFDEFMDASGTTWYRLDDSWQPGGGVGWFAYPIQRPPPTTSEPSFTAVPTSKIVPTTAPTNKATSTPSHIVPGGLWINPRNNFSVHGSTLHLAARAYPTNPNSPTIDHVQFTAWWPRLNPAVWYIPPTCIVSSPAAGTSGRYECDADLAGIPNGPLKVSFDVYDSAGNTNFAPNGIRTGSIQRQSNPAPEAFVSGAVFRVVGTDLRFRLQSHSHYVGGTCVRRITFHSHIALNRGSKEIFNLHLGKYFIYESRSGICVDFKQRPPNLQHLSETVREIIQNALSHVNEPFSQTERVIIYSTLVYLSDIILIGLAV